MRYWISWEQRTVDHRPLAFPPNKGVLGWWCSGYTEDGWATLCAAVDADNEEGAKSTVKIDWPEAGEWRYCEQRADDWMPNDRFPLKDWMVERLGGVY